MTVEIIPLETDTGPEIIPLEVARKSEQPGWIIPPVSERDEYGFRITPPKKEIQAGELAKAQAKPIIKQLGQAIEQIVLRPAAEVAVAAVEIPLTAVTAGAGTVVKGYGELFGINKLKQEGHALETIYTPIGEITKAVGQAFQYLDEAGSMVGEQNRIDFNRLLQEEFGMAPDIAGTIANVLGTSSETAIRALPYIMGIRHPRVQPIAPNLWPTVPDNFRGSSTQVPREIKQQEKRADVDFSTNFSVDNTGKVLWNNGLVQRTGELTKNDVLKLDDTTPTRSHADEVSSLKSLVDESNVQGITKIETKDVISDAMENQIGSLQHEGYTVKWADNLEIIIESDGIRTVKTTDGKPVAEVFPRKSIEANEIMTKEMEAALAEKAKREVDTEANKRIPRPKTPEIVDLRSVPELEKDLVKETEKTTYTTNAKGAVKFKTRDMLESVADDLPKRYVDWGRFAPFAGNWIPQSVVGILKNNQIAKWITSHIGREDQIKEMTKEQLLYESTIVHSLGRKKFEPSETALMPRLRQIQQKGGKIRDVFLELADKYDELGSKDETFKERTRTQVISDAMTRGLPRDQAEFVADTYIKSRQVTETVVGKVEATSSMLMKAGSKRGIFFEKHAGYIPHTWFGDFVTTLMDKETGKPLKTISSYSFWGKRKAEQRLKEEYPGERYSVKHEKRSFEKSDSAYEAIAHIIQAAERRGDEATVKALVEVQEKTGIRVHAKEREGARGFSWDAKTHGAETAMEGFINTTEAFTSAMLKADAGLRLKYKMDMLEQGPLSKLYPNSTKWARKYVEDYLGQKPFLDKAVDTLLSDAFGMQGARNVVDVGGKYITRASILMLQMVQIAAQPAQYKNTLVKLNSLAKEHGLTVDEIALIPFQAGLEVHNRSPDMQRALTEIAARGGIEQSLARMLYEQEGSYVKGSAKARYEIIKDVDKKLFSYPDEMQRMASAATFYHYLRKIGRDHDTAVTEAMKLTTDSSVGYTTVDRPAAYRGVTGAVLGKFGTWAASEIGQTLIALERMENKADVRTIATMIATTTAISGLTGLVGVKDADEVVKFTNSRGWTNTETPSVTIMKNAPDALAFGVIQSATETYFPAIGPLSFTRNMTQQPALSYFYRAGEALSTLGYKSIMGKASKLDEMRALMSLTPTTAKEFIRIAYENHKATLNPSTWYLKEGETLARRSMKDGALIYKYGPEDQHRAFLSMESLREHKLQMVSELIFSVDQGARNNYDAGVAFFVGQIVLRGDQSRFDPIIEDYTKEYGLDGKKFRKDVNAGVNKANIELKYRMLEGPSTKHTKGKYVQDLLDQDKKKQKEPEIIPLQQE